MDAEVMNGKPLLESNVPDMIFGQITQSSLQLATNRHVELGRRPTDFREGCGDDALPERQSHFTASTDGDPYLPSHVAQLFRLTVKFLDASVVPLPTVTVQVLLPVQVSLPATTVG